MSLHAYRVARDLYHQDTPFDALIMAAVLKGDTGNVERLKAAFPEVFAELTARYHAPAGLLPAERRVMEEEEP